VVRDAEKAEQLLKASFPSLEYTVMAHETKKKESLWKLRRTAFTAARVESPGKEADIVVPRNHLPAVVERLEAMAARHGVEFLSVGHAGDGNLHVLLLQKGRPKDEFDRLCAPFFQELYEFVCRDLGGAVTAEHGVGYVQKGYMAQMLSPAVIGLMKAIKTQFDPRGILNPGKVFVD